MTEDGKALGQDAAGALPEDPRPDEFDARERSSREGVLSDDMFRLLVESVKDYAIFLLDTDGVVKTWNEGARRLKGYTDAEIIGRHFSVFYPEEAKKEKRPQQALRIAVQEGRWTEEGWRIRRDGSRFWASVVVTALRDTTGTLVAFAKVTRDLTERKRAEEDLERSFELERATRLVAEADRERLISIGAVNDAALSSLELDDLLQQLLEIISRILAVDTVSILLLDESTGTELIARAAKGIEEEVSHQTRIPIGQGFAGRVAAERRPIAVETVTEMDVYNSLLIEKGIKSIVGVPLLIQGELLQGELLGVLYCGSLRSRAFADSDMTLLQIISDRVALAIEHARLVEATIVARRAAERAEAVLRVQDEFLTIAAHELKTPMTSLRLAVQLLLRRAAGGPDVDPEQWGRSLKMIERQSVKMTRLVTQLLQTVSLRGGRVQLQRTWTDLGMLLDRLTREMQDYTISHSITLRDGPSIHAHVDTLRLEQVVTNLLDNAIKYSPLGSVIEVVLSRHAGDLARITVIDSGIGVPEIHRAHLFERFYQAHGADYRSGMGLGLFVSKQIVVEHGGHMWAEFPEAGGSHFIVELPIGEQRPL